MVAHYFIGVLFTLAAFAVFGPLYLAFHLSHEDEKKQIHRMHLREKLHLSKVPLENVASVDIKCIDCGSHALTVEPQIATAA
jgi:hypothetical protein